MSAYVPPSQLGHWIRTDLGVRTFQGLGKNAPLRAQVVRRLTQDVHTHQILESLPCELHLQVPLHRRCLPGCGPQTSATRDIQTTFVYRLQPSLLIPCATSKELSPAPFPSGGGGFLVPFSVFFVSVSFVAVEGPPFSQFTADGASEDSTFGTQTLLAMRKFLDEAELRSHQRKSCNQMTKKDTNEGSTECKGEDLAEDGHEDLAEDGHRQTEVEKEVIRAFRTLLHGCEEQWCYATQQDSVSSESEAEEAQCHQTPHAMMTQLSLEDDLEAIPDQVAAALSM